MPAERKRKSVFLKRGRFNRASQRKLRVISAVTDVGENFLLGIPAICLRTVQLLADRRSVNFTTTARSALKLYRTVDTVSISAQLLTITVSTVNNGGLIWVWCQYWWLKVGFNYFPIQYHNNCVLF